MQRGLSMKEAAAGLGLPYSTYANYENGARDPNSEILIQLSKFFETTIDYLLGRSDRPDELFRGNLMPTPKTYSIPLVGTIACGEPILAAENIEDVVDAPEHIRADFALRCRGDSMTGARIQDGDIVYIRQQPTVENGEIAAVLIGDEATLKRVFLSDDRVILQPENPAFSPLVFIGAEIEGIRVLGRAVAFTSPI